MLALDVSFLNFPGDWVRDARCAEVDGDLFFPDGKGQGNTRIHAQAKAMCAACPVMSECREFGAGEEFGTWGGLTAHDRAQMRRAA